MIAITFARSIVVDEHRRLPPARAASMGCLELPTSPRWHVHGLDPKSSILTLTEVLKTETDIGFEKNDSNRFQL